jgi:hypothetical protein
MDNLKHDIEAALAESLVDVETGPLSDCPFRRAEVEPDGMLSLFCSDDPEAWPDASIDIPQLAGAILPIIAKVLA